MPTTSQTIVGGGSLAAENERWEWRRDNLRVHAHMGRGPCLHGHRGHIASGGAAPPLRRRVPEEQEPEAAVRGLAESQGGVDAPGLHLPPAHRLPERHFQNLRPAACGGQSPPVQAPSRGRRRSSGRNHFPFSGLFVSPNFRHCPAPPRRRSV